MWHGKTAEELGDLATGAGHLRRGVGQRPRSRRARAPRRGLEPLFAQVEYFRLLILAKQKPQQFLSEATSWLQHYRRLKQTDGYQGIALELAKASSPADNRPPARKKRDASREALQILIEMSKVRSQYQQEAILLRRDVLKAAGRSDLDVDTFDEAVALGDAAAAAAQWEQARDAYRKALEIAERAETQRSGRDRGGARGPGRRPDTMIARDLFARGSSTSASKWPAAIVFEDPRKKTVRKRAAPRRPRRRRWRWRRR